MEIFTIGFTQKSAEAFFGLLHRHEIKRLIDVRLNNVSQLAGFAKRDDLLYFLRAICETEYIHEPLLAPTQEMLDAYKKEKGDWREYERNFLGLMAERKMDDRLNQSLFGVSTVLLCSEPTPEFCHRRLIVEYLNSKWGDVRARHL